MFLKLDDTNVPMKQVYLLSEELKDNPERISVTQKLTLNSSRPLMGLKGTHGLFASVEWWDSIQENKIPLSYISGVIKRAYVSGQDEGPTNNTVDLVLDDNSTITVGIYTNSIKDVSLFNVGCKVQLVYALDELKKQPARKGGVNYSEIALEMAVSKLPN